MVALHCGNTRNNCRSLPRKVSSHSLEAELRCRENSSSAVAELRRYLKNLNALVSCEGHIPSSSSLFASEVNCFLSALFFAGKWSERGRPRSAHSLLVGLMVFLPLREERASEIHKFSRYPFISLIFLLQISSVPDACRVGEDAQPEHAEDLPSAAPPQARLRSSQ